MSVELSTERVAVHPGSSGIKLTPRETQIAGLVSLGYQHKQIAQRIGISPTGVSAHVSRIAKRIPGDANPSTKITVWYLTYRR